MSELVREYMGHFYDKTMFNKNKQNEEDEMQQKIQEELNLTLNPTSLLGNGMILQNKDKNGHDSILNSDGVRSGTADFLGAPAGKNPYGQAAPS